MQMAPVTTLFAFAFITVDYKPIVPIRDYAVAVVVSAGCVLLKSNVMLCYVRITTALLYMIYVYILGC